MSGPVRKYLLCLGALGAAGLLGPAGARAGGGWTRATGGGYAKIGLTTVSTTRYHPLGGGTTATARFRQQVVSLYAEYGLSSRWEVVLNAPVYRRAEFVTATPTQGVGDVQLGLRYAVLRGAWPLAVGLAVEAPTGNAAARGRNRQDPRLTIALPTGDNEWNVWARAALSHSLAPRLPAYVSLDVGYNQRTRGFTSQYTYGAEVGYQVGKAWLTATVRTLDNVRAPTSARLASIGLGEGVAYSSAALGVNYAISKHWWATLNVAGGFGRLRNVYSGVQPTAGVAYEW
ncbi:hypothetical protein KLP40_04975 [Hymenobacter sp. NST-14]|uniref:hypothetical protein n=1 Tax=Hymenobacter piscis TaxID=2839984 RepID=UPI001C00E3AB|nr:hypothetical protein [Hymenobacter piscis]MBT9392509.1 hypothetical protein [Hymenobacter piscis]